MEQPADCLSALLNELSPVPPAQKIGTFNSMIRKPQFWHPFVTEELGTLLSCHFKPQLRLCVGRGRAGVLEGPWATYSRGMFPFQRFCFKGTPPKCAALPELRRKHTLEVHMCFGRAGFIWCQAILSRRSELKVLTLPAEGPAPGGQLRLPRSPASQTYWDARLPTTR